MARQMRPSIASRILTLYMRLKAGRPLKVKEISDEFGIGLHRVRTDIKILRSVLPLEETRERRAKVYYLPQLDAQRHHLSQAMAMALGRAALGPFAETVYGEEAEKLYIELSAGLSTAERERLKTSLRAFYVHRPESSSRPERAEVVETLLDALLHQRQIKIRYERLRDLKVKEYQLDPLALVYQRDQLQLVARKREKGWPVHSFDIDGIIECTMRPRSESFDPPRGFSVEETFRHTFGRYLDFPTTTVVLETSGITANYLRRRRIHPSQETLADDGLTLKLRLSVGICPDLKAWIKSQLPELRVISPSTLIEELNAELRRAMERLAEHR